MDSGELRPLHGVPIAVKDMEMTAGIRTTFGSLLFKDHVPDEDSVVVKRIRRSGAVILGKANTPEFAASGSTENRLGDACRNPWDTTRTAGGSSGGSGAAIAAGLCALATGSDSGGSIRVPASYCGVYGIKPDFDGVPHFRSIERAALDPVLEPGPMALTVRDAALFLQVLVASDEGDSMPSHQRRPDYLASLDAGVKGLRIAWNPHLGYAAVNPEVARITSEAARAFEEMGALVEEPEMRLEVVFSEDAFSQLNILHLANQYAEYGHLLEERSDDLTHYVRESLERGRQITGADYSRALAHLEQVRLQIGAMMQTYDLLLNPTMPAPAFPADRRPVTVAGRQATPQWVYNPFNFVFNMTRQPAASVPCGFSSDGLPIGLHVVGHRGDEATVLKASAAFEQARPWADKHPPVS